MIVENIPIRTFLETLDKWLHAVLEGRFIDADFQMKQMKAVGRMLTSDPAFRRALEEGKQVCSQNDSADDPLSCICALAHSVGTVAQHGRKRPQPGASG